MTEENGFASAEQLFSATPKRRFRIETLPISGHKVRIRSLTERELSRYQSATIGSSGTNIRKARLEDATRRLIVLCLVDQAGNQLLNDSYQRKLADWDAADTSFLYDACAAHCGINRQDIEDLVKNSEETSVVCSPSSSPSE